MIFYIATDADGQRHLVGTQADARAIDRNFVQVDIPTDKAGLRGYIQDLLTEIDELRLGAGRETTPGTGATSATQPPAPSYVQQSVNLDEQFDKLPLAHQLHFAAIAMENARDRLGHQVQDSSAEGQEPAPI